MSDHIQEAIWEGSFTVCGKVLRCYVLKDGTRIIDSEDMHNFFLSGLEIDPLSDSSRQFLEWVAGA